MFCCRLQDQSASRKNQHIHQDTGPRRGAGVCGHRPQGGRRARQARDPLGGRALLSDPRVAQVWRGPAAARRRARSCDRAGARALPRRGARRRPQGCHHQAYPAHDAHIHCDTVARARASVRGDGPAGERGGGAQGDRGAHRTAHRGCWSRRRRRARRHRQWAAGHAVPRRAGVAAAAWTGGRLLVGWLLLIRWLVCAAGRPAGHLVIHRARRRAGWIAVIRIARRRHGGSVGVGPDAAIASRFAGAGLCRVRRARRGGGAGAVRPQPVLPGVRAAAGGHGRALPRLLGAGAPGHPHHLVRRLHSAAGGRRNRESYVLVVGIFFTRIVIKNIKRSKNRVIEILVPKVGASPARPVRRAVPILSRQSCSRYIFLLWTFFIRSSSARRALRRRESRSTLR